MFQKRARPKRFTRADLTQEYLQRKQQEANNMLASRFMPLLCDGQVRYQVQVVVADGLRSAATIGDIIVTTATRLDTDLLVIASHGQCALTIAKLMKTSKWNCFWDTFILQLYRFDNQIHSFRGDLYISAYKASLSSILHPALQMCCGVMLQSYLCFLVHWKWSFFGVTWPGLCIS